MTISKREGGRPDPFLERSQSSCWSPHCQPNIFEILIGRDLNKSDEVLRPITGESQKESWGREMILIT